MTSPARPRPLFDERAWREPRAFTVVRRQWLRLPPPTVDTPTVVSAPR